MENREIKFKYVFDDDYEPEYVTGAFGGVMPGGDLVVNFFLERLPIPYETKQAIDENGILDPNLTVVNPEPSDYNKIRRTVKNGIILNTQTALSIYRWMKDKLSEMGVDESEL